MIEIYGAGAIAAFTVDLLIYPLDTLKTRYQSQDYIKTYVSSSTKRIPPLGGLYQGVGSVILATLPAAGIFFSTYEGAKQFIGKTRLPDPLVHMSASALAEMASCMVLAPAEVIKQNAQMIRRNEAGSRGIGRLSSTSLQVFRQLGGAGASKRLFTGYSALAARNLPFTALQFPIFEHVRARIWESRTAAGRDISRRSLVETGLINGCSAGGAGALAAFITTPSDVVKTRMMLSAGSQEYNQASAEIQGRQANKSAWVVAREVYVERGAWGFFRGAALRSGWTMLGSGLYLGTYEMAKEWLNRRHETVERPWDMKQSVD
ncbi:putative mitochondrial carrier protein [Mariannaea sp. PMI_226]|nr:putative mitochondrial carrier protein [Mariannaea sp. PMI_226]